MRGEALAQVFAHDKIIFFPGCKKKAYVVLCQLGICFCTVADLGGVRLVCIFVWWSQVRVVKRWLVLL